MACAIHEADTCELERVATEEPPPEPDLLEGVDFVVLFLVLAWMFGVVLARPL